MSDVKLADCRVAYNFEVAPNGAEVWDERPMSEADLDSLIRERYADEGRFGEAFDGIDWHLTLLENGKQGYDETIRNIVGLFVPLAALTGEEE